MMSQAVGQALPMGNQWHQHLSSFSNMLHLSYQNKQPITPSAFFDQLAQQV